MTRRLLLVAALVAAVRLSAIAGGDYDIVAGQRVGPVAIGGDPDALLDTWGEARGCVASPEEDADTPIPGRYLEYPEKGLWFLTRGYRIEKIGVERGPWRTKEGVKLWSPAREVERLYGKGERRDPKEKDSLERYFVHYPRRGIAFLIRGKTGVVEAIHIYRPTR